ncbi:MAG: 50S ribosomal protein L3 [Parcubacteria group bacterium]|nr:50S ribosomal protein L3 [Parcubacteria group bacterium]
MKFILAKKLNMSSVFDEKGKIIPVTILEAGPVKITQIKNKDKDSYEAVQLGFGTKKRITKPLLGHLKDNGKLRWLREFRIKDSKDLENYKVGDEIKVDVFKEGELVNISGISRGKGFQGVVKRHGFHGTHTTHGNKDQLRTSGSIGATTPQRVIKGKKMAGRTGGERVSLRKVKIIKIDPDKNLIYLKGAVPGKRGTLIEIFN